MTKRNNDAIDPFGVGAVGGELKRLSVTIDERRINASFAPNDCPFVDQACECIEHGGDVDHTSLALLLHHIAVHLKT